MLSIYSERPSSAQLSLPWKEKTKQNDGKGASFPSILSVEWYLTPWVQDWESQAWSSEAECSQGREGKQDMGKRLGSTFSIPKDVKIFIVIFFFKKKKHDFASW